MPSQDLVDLVERLRALSRQGVAHLRQKTVLLFVLAGNMNPSYTLHAIASQQTIPIDPQKFAQRVSIPAICLSARPLHRLHHDHVLATTIRPQPFHQPILKPTHFQESHVRFFVSSTLLVDLFDELVDLLPASAHLPAEYDVATFVAKGYRHLLAMEVDSKVQHGRFSWWAAIHAAAKSFGEPLWLRRSRQENPSLASFIESDRRALGRQHT
jgi:hypothetical protein